MRCTGCGNESNEGVCPVCGRDMSAASRITVLSRAEKDDFDGITIEQGYDGRSDEYYQQKHARPEFGRVYVKHIELGGWGGLLSKLLIAALLLFILFVALPVAVLLMLIGTIFWFFRRR